MLLADCTISRLNPAYRGFIPNTAWQSLRESLRLSPREVEITQYVLAGEKGGNIAESLGISRHTVDTYLRRLYTKLDVSSRQQLILRVLGEYYKPIQ